MNDSSEMCVWGKNPLFSENSSCYLRPKGISNPSVHFGKAESRLLDTVIHLMELKEI